MITLKKHQLRAVEHARKNQHLAIFSPTGSGKSIAAMACAFSAWGCRRILILARANNLLTWQAEGEIYGCTIEICRRRAQFSDAFLHSVVVSHDFIGRHHTKMVRQGFEALIVDESWQIQNFDSSRSRAAYYLSRKIGRTIILNALPFSDQGYAAIFSQYKVMDCGQTFGTGVTQFREEYQCPHPSGYGWIDNPAKATQLSQKAAQRGLFLKLEDCDLPQEIDKVFKVEWLPKQKEIYQTLKKEWEVTVGNSTISTSYKIVQLGKLHQILGGIFRTPEGIKPILTAKTAVLLGILEELKKKKVVIWCAYSPEIEMLRRMLRLEGYNVSTYQGHDSRVPTGWDILVGQIRCAVGINELTDIQYTIYYSHYWSWYHYMQSRGRTARITSKHKQAFYFHLEIPGSVDSLIMRNLKNKNSDADQFVREAQSLC